MQTAESRIFIRWAAATTAWISSAVFGIEDYFWQPQLDGSVFVGSWNHSRWATRSVEIEEKFFTGVTGTGAKVLPAIPVLRAGVLLNGQRVNSL